MTEQKGSGAAVRNPAGALSEVARNQQVLFDSSRGITRVLGFHPTVPHPCSLVKGVFEPSDRGSLSQHRHQQANRVAPVQPFLGCSFSQNRRTSCAVDGLFQSISHRGGFVRLSCSPGCPLFCSLCSLVRSPRCRRHCFLCSVGLFEQVKRFRETLAFSWSLSPSLPSLFNLSSLPVSQSHNAVGLLPWLCQGSWFFSTDFASEDFLLHRCPVKVPVSRKPFTVHLGS